MKRRTFLKATLITAGSAVTGIGCGDGSSGGETDAMGMGDSMDASGMDAGEQDVWMEEELLDGADYFPQSLMSGDPREDGVILWTRCVDGDLEGDLDVTLQLALDEAFEERVELDGSLEISLTALAAFDHCVKARVTGLEAGTTYYYRFVYRTDDAAYTTVSGRTKTAPANDADVPARFAFVSCQDFNGRYYNPYKRLVEEDIDFFVHLGDYIYETTGSPQFQISTPERSTVFTDTEGAIPFEVASGTFYAARSLSNYRELYQIYRNDPHLRKMHERFPVVAVWDDHEFSDDSHGATATYYDGRSNEEDVERRKNANQAWFEYMPVDYMGAPDFVYDPEAAFPGDLDIYREIRYGKHLHLLMTDLRTYRADHVIAEDALPGAVVVDGDALAVLSDELQALATGYVDIDDAMYADYRDALVSWAEGIDYPTERITGKVLVDFINGVLEDEGSDLDLLAAAEGESFPLGLAYSHAFKSSAFAQLGSRYLSIKDTYDALADQLYAESGGESEVCMGDAQENWFLETMQSSDKTWKVWGNEYCLFRKVIDVSNFPSLPDAYRQKYLLSVEDWAGFPNKRDELISALADVGNVVSIVGDIHAFFASTPWVRGDHSKRISEFVTAGISSGSYRELLIKTASADADLVAAGADALAYLVEDLFFDSVSIPSPDLAYAKIDRHGYVLVEAGADTFDVAFHAIEETHALTDVPTEELAELFETQHFQVRSGTPDIYMEIEGEWKRWDSDISEWVSD